MDVKLYSQKCTYTDKEGKNQPYTNFYLQCGGQLVPIDVKYFKKQNGEKDKGFIVRKGVLEAFADPLPPKEQ